MKQIDKRTGKIALTVFLAVVISVSAVAETLICLGGPEWLYLLLMWTPALAATIANCISFRENGEPFRLKKLFFAGGFRRCKLRYLLLGWLLPKVGAFPVSRGNNDIQSVKTAIQALKGGDNLLIFPEGTVIRNGLGYVDGLPPHAKGGVAVIGVRTGATLIPVFVDGEKKLFHKTRIIFGEPYQPVYTGRHGTAEEMQKIADDILEAAYALGGQAVGGAPLCKE